ncbi:MAG: right-handed parallel beta-helix repeat-containing protein [Deltaproteobacteria bacterium]|nr:right-handed parallel beta-helix repeat-containing protein [Deltaproteobacteria bacterium]
MKKMKAYFDFMNPKGFRIGIKYAAFFAAIATGFTLFIMFPVYAQQQASQQRTSGIQREAEPGLPARCVSAGYMQDGGTVTQEGKTYTSTKSGVIESVVCVKNGGWLTLVSPKIRKPKGDKDAGEFGGQGVEAAEASVVNLLDAEIYTETDGANGLWATNEGSMIYMRGGSITTFGESAHGMDVTKRASVILYDMKISTSGGIACGALVNDSGDGTVYATRVTAHTKGYGSPGFYMIGSKSMLTVKDSTIEAEGSDAGVLLYSADVTVENTVLKGAKGVKVAGGTFTMTGGSLTTTGGDAFTIVSGEDGPSGGAPGGARGSGAPSGSQGGGSPPQGGMPGGAGGAMGGMAGSGMPGGSEGGAPPGGEIGGGQAGGVMPGGSQGGAPGGAAPGGLFGGARSGNSTITLKDGVKISASTGNIISVPANNKAAFTASNTDLKGDVIVAETGELSFTLNKSTLTGKVENAAISMDSSSKWDVTGDSAVTSLSNSSGISGNNVANIYGNGHTVYYDKGLEENKALGGKTYSLAKGGKLVPKK